MAINMPNAPDWLVGAGGVNELKIVSPLNAESAHSYDSMMKVIVHELVHSLVLDLRGSKSLIDFPKWLNEGYAYYEAQQMTAAMRRSIKAELLDKLIPSWSDLANSNAEQFGNMQDYQYSATIIEFLVERYGSKKLVRLINDPNGMVSIYGVSKIELERMWVDYLKTTL